MNVKAVNEAELGLWPVPNVEWSGSIDTRIHNWHGKALLVMEADDGGIWPIGKFSANETLSEGELRK